MKRYLWLGLRTTLLSLAVLTPVSHESAVPASAQSDQVRAPMFVVDPYWPKPLPNHWVTGSTIGVATDAQDHVWTIQRGFTVEDNFKAADLKLGLCCKVAPPVLEYDQAGNLVNSWGGPGTGYRWPDSEHGIMVDHHNHVWIGGNGQKDTEILEFTTDGKFLMQLGTYGEHNGSNDTKNFWMPTKIFDEPEANEIYVSDGYGNHRIIVFDENTGKYKRHWGAYGTVPVDDSAGATGDNGEGAKYDPAAPPSKIFKTPHCVMVAHDGLVYVCDRVNDRIQVFHKDGKFVKEAFIDRQTLRSGSVWDMTFSRDQEQTYIYMVNGVNEKVEILDRSTLHVLTTFGDGGRQPGEFFGSHNITTDSKGNIYVTETYTGARVQRFLYKGIGMVPRDQGVPWPKSN